MNLILWFSFISYLQYIRCVCSHRVYGGNSGRDVDGGDAGAAAAAADVANATAQCQRH